ncbi:hypothetical protein [Streptacidiphilus sp. EB103A]|uniref:hypothetical protein n=1 Tax=Streptacidiphilus sp. EB103A TaxID=3156275 RepID=UPI003512F512
MPTTETDLTNALDLVRADGIRHYQRAAVLLADAEMSCNAYRRTELMERCERHTELAKAAALLSR